MTSSPGRILTTHVGSLPRPVKLLDAMRERYSGETYDQAAFDEEVKSAVNEIVKTQAEIGIDVVSDGEMGKLGFFAYVRDRLTGFAGDDAEPAEMTYRRPKEVRAFPEYYERYFAKRSGPRISNLSRMVKCTGPISYKGQEALAQDIANLKSAMAAAGAERGFMPAVAPSGVGRNDYYRSEEEYQQAVAEAMREEYKGIVDAGLDVQLDDAWLTSLYNDDDVTAGARKKAEMFVEVVNHALRGIPQEHVRFHTCYGINEGPRLYDVPLEQYLDIMLKMDAGAYSFEAANPRHDHEWHVWARHKLPDGKKIIPGVITHSTNVIEHPELVADRLCNFASVVGRDNVIAGADCGFSSNASYETDIPIRVVWEKFKAMVEGAELASRRLWG